MMEYVGGESLREIAATPPRRDGTAAARGPGHRLHPGHPAGLRLPAPPEACSFCDFKPDNVIHTEEQLTLIDLGGVRAIDDESSDLCGTIGYQAPEIADVGRVDRLGPLHGGPHPGRARPRLRRLPGREALRHQLPPGQRGRRRSAATRPSIFHAEGDRPRPAARFQSAGEMAEQLLGVLRQVRGDRRRGPPRRPPSLLFSTSWATAPTASAWQICPVPAVDPSDPAAAVLADRRSRCRPQISGRGAAAAALARGGPPPGPGLPSTTGRLAAADAELDSPEARSAGWRAAWWRGSGSWRPADRSTPSAYFAAVAGRAAR